MNGDIVTRPKIGDRFALKENIIPKEVLDDAKEEALAIYESDYTDKKSLSGRNRSYENILEDTLIGKIGEYFIKSRFSYVNDNAKWHDIISPEGVRTEVKTRRKQYLTEKKVRDDIAVLKNRKKHCKKWFFSTEVIFISFDEESNIFEVYGVYNID